MSRSTENVNPFENLFNISTSDILSISNNVANSISKMLETIKNPIQTILENPNIQVNLEYKLKTLLTK